MMRELHDRLTTKPSRQLTANHLRRLIWCCIAFLWAPLFLIPAYAAVMPSTMTDPLNIPPVLMGLALVISTLAGSTALLMRIDRELSAAPDHPLPHPWIMSASHMLGAWLAGSFAFIVSQEYHFEVWPTLGFVLGASFGNAKFLEAMLEKYLPSRNLTTPLPLSDPPETK